MINDSWWRCISPAYSGNSKKNIKVPFYNILSERDSMYIITPWLATSLYIVDCWGSTEYSHLASSLWSGDTGTVDWSGQSSVRAGQCRSEDKRRQSWWSPALQLQSDFSSSLSSFRPVGAGTAPPEVSQNILLLFFILVEKNIYFYISRDLHSRLPSVPGGSSETRWAVKNRVCIEL